MNREDALEEAAKVLFEELVNRSGFWGFYYHPVYGIVPGGSYPSDMSEEDFLREAVLIEEYDDLETFIMAIEENPPV